MRLHHLEATAFGPFAGTVRVDFDQLGASGLFLLSGATGAGKTSVLDAVCFALYGEVPGDRSSARRLRSDQAGPGVAPEVRLEATLAGRRFRIVRSPAWERPKKRGTGTTTQQASVSIAERVGGEWSHLSSRLDETGHLVSRLVGMNLTQFTQVAMLPQGRFQAFLRARSEERHQLLQQLFRTGRFEQVERWLRDRRLDLRRSCEQHHQAVADLVSRVSEATERPLPGDWEVRDLTEPAADGRLLAWAQQLHTEATEALREAMTVAERQASAELDGRRALEQACALAERKERLDRATAELAALDAGTAQHEDDRARLDLARRAAVVVPLHRVADRTLADLTAARERADAAVAAAAPALGLLILGGADEVSADDLAEAERAAVDELARVRAVLPQEALLQQLETQVGQLKVARERTAIRFAGLRARAEELPPQIQEVRTDLESARLRAAEVPVLEAALSGLRSRLTAHQQLAELEPRLAAACAALDEAREVAARRREHWLDIREARLEGMAAEIAGALAVGACCPVCGSADHPHKAAASPDAPDAAAERRALREVDDAKAGEHLHDQAVRDLTTQLGVARDRAGGGTLAEVEAESARVREQLGAARDAADRATALAAREKALDEERESLAEQLAVLGEERSRLEAEEEGCAAQAAQAAESVRALLRGSGHDRLEALAGALAERVDLLRAAARAVDDLAGCLTAERAAQESLRSTAAEAGFDTVGDALDAVLPPRDVESLTRRIDDHQRRRAAVTAVLEEEPGAADLAAVPLPDVPSLEQAHAAALAALGEARSRESRWQVRAQRLAELVSALEQALAEWHPLREELQTTSDLCSFVEGKSAANRLQMRLSAYVLAYRLAQVVASANQRLARMSDGRYSLEHTGRRGAGETRGGLSLLVRDDWSGESRDPATLSGGETFVVSLALALGLADVITQEAGGADLDTLFVDEGFGSLDADTLDDVLDVLDSLRDGGRIVGVVSHVPEMRDRIPTQLVVSKGRAGSTVAIIG
ncbi:AAA family ATPase [Nocardioides ferulae]|uniref:AAA family ATPase n=1 Tax=Nocardioides ferulae TaxID=2340821 RepID=UPI000EB17797|nr:SMC family ATPase [Nocardioides ferulae]